MHSLHPAGGCKDKPKALKRDSIYNIDMLFSKKRFRAFTIKAWTYAYVPAARAHFTHSASIVLNRKTQRSLVRGRGTSVGYVLRLNDHTLHCPASQE